MQTITTFLSFPDQAEEAVNYYVSLFKDSKIESMSHYGEGMPLPAGTVLAINFKLAGQDFVALNIGQSLNYKFTPAISLLVNCDTQEEIDNLWAKLSAVPEAEACGWCQDKFGITWQIVPTVLGSLMSDKDAKKSSAVAQVMMPMKKIDLKALQDAYDNA